MPQAAGDLLVIGVVHGPHGLSGAVSVTSCSGESEHFLHLKEIQVRQGDSTRVMAIESLEEGPKGLIVRFRGVESPEEAARLHGAELLALRCAAAPLGRDQYYTVDLAGCELVQGGKCLATVLSVREGAQADLLEARKPDGSVALVPFMGKFIGKVDTAARRIELLESWILE